MAKIQIESTDNIFWDKLIEWLNDYPCDANNPTTIRLMNDPSETIVQQPINREEESIDELFDRVDKAFSENVMVRDIHSMFDESEYDENPNW